MYASRPRAEAANRQFSQIQEKYPTKAKKEKFVRRLPTLESDVRIRRIPVSCIIITKPWPAPRAWREPLTPVQSAKARWMDNGYCHAIQPHLNTLQEPHRTCRAIPSPPWKGTRLLTARPGDRAGSTRMVRSARHHGGIVPSQCHHAA